VGFLTIFLYIVYVLVCLFLIMVVLLQQGKGADLAGAFGGGGSQTSFGPRTGTNIMHRLTTISFVLFVVLSVTLAVRSGLERGESVVTDIKDKPVAEETATEGTATEPAEPAEGTTMAAEEAGDAETGAAAEAGTQGEAPAADQASEQPAAGGGAESQPEPGS